MRASDAAAKRYCPVHEFETLRCNSRCEAQRIALRSVDAELRRYWEWKGSRFGFAAWVRMIAA